MNRTPFCIRSLLISLVLVTAADCSGQQREPWTTSRLQGTPTPPPDYKISRVFSRHTFDHPTSIQEIPATGEILVTQMNGQIFTFAKSGRDGEAHRVTDLAQLAGGGVNLFSAARHPDFADNGWLFVCLVHPEGARHTRVSRYTTTRNAAGKLVLDNDSERVIIRWPSGGHNAGCLRFGPDGLLYISTGDGSGPNPPDGLTTGQDVTDLLGALLRIDVDQTSGDNHYAIPTENPFVGTDDARPEIFAYGLRNPWKFDIDALTGDVFVADNGWETWEMVHHVRSGQNCGWPVMEGRAELRMEVKVGPTPIVPPARDHHHSEANSVIGGPICRDAKLKALEGFFIYGDYITGTIWGLKRDGSQYVYRDIVDTDLRIVDFTLGSDGELFVLDYDYTGGIYELLPNDVEDLSDHFPRLLSETGLFRSVRDLKPAAGVYEYDVVVPRWQDGATAKRWVAVPGLEVIGLDGRNADRLNMEYPDGTVLAKHLSIPADPPTPLETQILHFDNGVWNPYSYLWNDDATDAKLVSSAGANRSVTWPADDTAQPAGDRTWRAGATNECRLCHNAGSNFVLGFNRNQLRKETAAGHTAESHVSALRQAGILGQGRAAIRRNSLVDPHDETLDLNDRARSYLHVNCSNCHHKRGNAIISFYLSGQLPFDELKTNKGTGIGTFGMRNAKIIVPGDPWRSVLMYRMSKLGYARMPYIGSQVVDSKGVALIADWILSLSDDRSARSSAPLVADSAEARALQLLTTSATSGRNRAAVQNLTGSTEGSLALLAQLHGGTLSPAERSAAVEFTKTAGSDIRGLFAPFVPEALRKKTLGRTFDPQIVLAKDGDARRGKLVFFTNDARCRGCHDVHDAGRSVGPTLTEIAKKYSRRSELLQHVVKPSEKIDEKYAASVVVTSQGRVLSGLLVKSDNDDSITLRTAEGKTISVAKTLIEEHRKSTTSLMPDGVLADLTAQEAADLLAYIQSIVPQ